MQYFSLKQLKEQISLSFEWSDSMSFLPTKDKKIDEFITFCNNGNNRLFVGWVSQSRGLEELLITGFTHLSYKDDLKLKEHLLFLDFQKFVSEFLSELLLATSKKEEIDYISFSYLGLLESDSRLIVEHSIYSRLKIQLQKINTSFEASNSEDELITEVQSILNDNNLDLIDHFSRQSYALKMDYVENCLNIISSRNCTTRLAYWVVKQLETLHLNQEHIQKISDLKTAINTGEIKLKNVGKRKTSSFLNRTVLGGLAFLLFFGFALWIIIQKPWSDSDRNLHANNSSYKDFSPLERTQIDSLLKIIQPKKTFTPENYDIGNYLDEELELILRSPLKNKRAEQYYQDLALYAENYDQIHPDTCKILSSANQKKLIPSGMVPLSEKKDGKEAILKNESSYDVQIIVFKNLSSEVYYRFVQKGGKINFQLEVGDLFYMVPGTLLTSFQLPENYSGEGFSKGFSNAFCEIDVNFLHGINTTHELASNTRGNYKFLLIGSETEQFDLVDLYSVLLPH